LEVKPVYSRKTKGAATFTVAASDSPSASKTRADYVCDGTADDVQVQAAVDALPSTGGLINLIGGNFTFAATVSRDLDNVIIKGQGKCTYLANDGSTKLFSAGLRDGWGFHNLAVDAGGIDFGFNEQSDVRNVWVAGRKKDNRKVNSVKFSNTLASAGYQGAHDVAVQGDRAFAACYHTDAVHEIDISDPESPTLDDTLTDGSGRLDGAHDIIVDGDYAYVACAERDSVCSIDISTPGSLAFSSEVRDPEGDNKLNACHALSKQGNWIYAGGLGSIYFCVIDATDPTNLHYEGSCSHATYLNQVRGTYPKDNYVYCITKNGGYLTVIDVSTKASPEIAASGAAHIQVVSGSTGNDAANIRVKGNYAYCTTLAHDELVVVDISDVSSMSVVARVTIEDAYYITLAGDYAFVSSHTPRHIYVVNISDPIHPFVTRRFYHNDLEFVSGMAVYGNYLICAPRDLDDSAVVTLKIPPEAGDFQIRKMIEFTRDMQAASGDVTYEGFGFRPTHIEAKAAILGHETFSTGFALYTTNHYAECMYHSGDNVRCGWSMFRLVALYETETKAQKAYLKNFTDDGFVLHWEKVGTPSALTGRLLFTAIKED